MINKIESIKISDIDVNHLNNGCFHNLNLIEKSKYLTQTPIYISTDRKLYGTSLSVYHSLIKQRIENATAIVVSEIYDEKLDLYYQNISSNVTLLYYKIKKKFENVEDVEDCEFDDNQLDLMYYIDLDDNESLDLRVVEEETAKIKKTFNITVVLKTLDENFIIQKFFDTNRNEIEFDYFQKIISGAQSIMDEFLKEEKEDSFFRQKTYPEFVIKCSTMDQMTTVLDFFKLSKGTLKTSRVNFKRIESVFK